MFFLFFRKEPDGKQQVGYATEATVMLDQNSLQAAMDAAMENAKDGNVALLYKNDAYSENSSGPPVRQINPMTHGLINSHPARASFFSLFVIPRFIFPIPF